MLKPAFFEKYKHLIGLCLIFLISFFCFAWVGYKILPQASGLGKREIIHDDYSVLTKEFLGTDGIKQNIVLKENTRLYGVNLNFHIYDAVRFGTVYVDLLTSTGETIATSSADMSTLLDNTFKRFIFDKYVVSDKPVEYILHIYSAPQSENDKIALWKSETTKPGFSLTENAAKTEGTVALQYITSYVGSFIYTAYFVVAFILIAFLLLLYYLIFIKKAKIEVLFLVYGFIVGGVFLFFTPQRGGPDEYVHIASAYYNSNIILGVENTWEQDKLVVRKCDSEKSLLKVANYSPLEWQETFEGLFTSSKGQDELVTVDGRITKVFPPLYFAQTLGITLARIFNFGYIPMLLMGRLFNLLLYLAVVFLAIKAMPFFKLPFTLIALSPIALQTAASFSYDTLVICSCFLFISLCLKYKYEEKPLSIKNIVLLAVVGMIIAPSKSVYIPVVFFALIIPNARFENVKKARYCKAAIIAFAGLLWFLYNLNVLFPQTAPALPPVDTGSVAVSSQQIDITDENTQQADKTPEEIQHDLENLELVTRGYIKDNGDSMFYYNPSYILSHIPSTVKLLINTLQDKLPSYIQSLFGGHLGEIIVSPLVVNWLYVFAVIFILLLSMVSLEGKKVLYKGYVKYLGLLIAAICCGLFVLACITWTPINYAHIFGIQGRYALPVLPLILFFFANENIVLKKSIDGALLFSFISVDILILLDAFSIMAVNIK